MNNDVLLQIRDLKTSFRIKDDYYNAVNGVSINLNRNEVLAIVGESGCGKSTLATSIIGLHDYNFTKVEGEIIFEGVNLVGLDEQSYNKIRGKKIGMIFQDPLSALNPLMRVGDQIEESLIYHKSELTKEQRRKKVIELIDMVGIPDPEKTARRFPHQLSGGMRQRIVIAIALSCEPDILICDEPTTALDVTIQAQILDLIRKLQEDLHAGVILITHDLGVVAEMADRVAVMYAGEIVELASSNELFNNPKHPYTRSLLSSIPQLDREEEHLHVIEGTVPSLKNLPEDGCRFSPRIPWISSSEHERKPQLHEISENHFVQCTCYKNFHFAGGENK